MTSETADLLNKARELPHSHARFDLTKEAVRVADVSNDLDSQFQARLALTEAASFAEKPQEMIVAYVWLLNHREAFGDSHDYTFLWSYKWILDRVLTVASFSTEQIEYFFADCRKRYEFYFGPQLPPVEMLEVKRQIMKGEFASARELLERAEGMPRLRLSDCHACDDARRMDYWYELEDPERAMDAYEEMLESGKKCQEQPASAHANAAHYYAAMGRWEDAAAAYRGALDKSNRRTIVEKEYRNLMAYCLLAGKEAEAVEHFDRAFEEHKASISRLNYFELCLIGHRLMNVLLEKGHASLPLKSAGAMPGELKTEGGEVLLAKLGPWLLEEASEVGRTFDRRNGATAFAKVVEARWPWPWAAPEIGRAD